MLLNALGLYRLTSALFNTAVRMKAMALRGTNLAVHVVAAGNHRSEAICFV